MRAIYEKVSVPVFECLFQAIEGFVRINIETIRPLNPLRKEICAHEIHPVSEAQIGSGPGSSYNELWIGFYADSARKQAGKAGNQSVSAPEIDEKPVSAKIELSKEIVEMGGTRCSPRPGCGNPIGHAIAVAGAAIVKPAVISDKLDRFSCRGPVPPGIIPR